MRITFVQSFRDKELESCDNSGSSNILAIDISFFTSYLLDVSCIWVMRSQISSRLLSRPGQHYFL